MAKTYDELLELVLENKETTRRIMANGTDAEKEAFRKRQQMYKGVANSKTKETQKILDSIAKFQGSRSPNASGMSVVLDEIDNARLARFNKKNAEKIKTLTDSDAFKNLSKDEQRKILGKLVPRSTSEIRTKAALAETYNGPEYVGRSETQKRIDEIKSTRSKLADKSDPVDQLTARAAKEKLVDDFKKRHPNYVSVKDKDIQSKEAKRAKARVINYDLTQAMAQAGTCIEIEKLKSDRDKMAKQCEQLIHDIKDIKDDSTKKNETVKIVAAVTGVAAVVGTTIRFLKKHSNKNSKAKVLAKKAEKLQKEMVEINERLKKGEISRKDAVAQTKKCNKEFDALMKEIESLSKPKSVKESVDFDTDLEDEILHVFEYARDSGLDDSEIYEVLESAFGEESLHDFANFDEPKTYDVIHSICEAVEAGEIDINDGLELIELLENTN